LFFLGRKKFVLMMLGYETLGGPNRHWLSPVTLPQDKAEVTKTFSKRKLGFSYGFLALAGS
jgi:hypothetical protein